MIHTAVFSQWSAPHKIKHRHSSLDLTGLALWVLSQNRAKTHFARTELVTDKMGAALLVDQLGLKFDEVRVVLDDFVPAGLSHIWCLGKLKAYSEMQYPFLHIDHDVVLWKKLPERLQEAPIICQNPEHLSPGHKRREWYDIAALKSVPIKPEWVMQGVGKADDLSINMGIYGGNDLEFIHEAAKAGLETALNPGNFQYLRRAEGTVMSVFLEQYWTASLARSKSRQFESLLSEDKEISAIQSKGLGYSHYWGDRKRRPLIMEKIQGYCKRYHPRQFAICQKIAEQDNK